MFILYLYVDVFHDFFSFLLCSHCLAYLEMTNQKMMVVHDLKTTVQTWMPFSTVNLPWFLAPELPRSPMMTGHQNSRLNSADGRMVCWI